MEITQSARLFLLRHTCLFRVVCVHVEFIKVLLLAALLDTAHYSDCEEHLNLRFISASFQFLPLFYYLFQPEAKLMPPRYSFVDGVIYLSLVYFKIFYPVRIRTASLDEFIFREWIITKE